MLERFNSKSDTTFEVDFNLVPRRSQHKSRLMENLKPEADDNCMERNDNHLNTVCDRLSRSRDECRANYNINSEISHRRIVTKE